MGLHSTPGRSLPMSGPSLDLRARLHWLASVQMCTHWFGYHETVGRANAVKRDNIIANTYIFLFLLIPFCRLGVASALRPARERKLSPSVSTQKRGSEIVHSKNGFAVFPEKPGSVVVARFSR